MGAGSGSNAPRAGVLGLSGFKAEVLGVLAGLALALAAMIFARESWDGYAVSFYAIALWQLAIWLPWLLAIWPLDQLVEQLERERPIRNLAGVGATAGLLLLVHMAYVVALSTWASPIGHLPATGYGVYPYFFIFFAVLDGVIIWRLMARVGIFQLVDSRAAAAGPERLEVRVSGKTVFVDPEDINWISSEDYYSRIHLVDASHLVRMPMRAILDALPAHTFVRVHRSTIVRMAFVAEIQPNRVVLRDGTVRPVSRQGRRRIEACPEDSFAAR